MGERREVSAHGPAPARSSRWCLAWTLNAARWRRSARAISQHVARAERAGLVERAPVGGSRAVEVTLTSAWHALVEQLVDAVMDRGTLLRRARQWHRPATRSPRYRGPAGTGPAEGRRRLRVVGLGDAHLGRSYYTATTAGGVNQREADFDRSFEAAVELALAQSPDAVVWLGDVFDHPRPTYRSFRIAQRALARLDAVGVPTVVISGNHDTPRLPGTESPYAALADAFPRLHFACRFAYERIDLGEVVVHAVPQMMAVEDTLAALGMARASASTDATNLLLTHPRVPQLEPAHSDINEIEVDAGELQADLVLLGHYHFHARVAERIWYAGATDTFSFADNPERPKGIVVLDTVQGTCRHVPLAGCRPLETLPGIDAYSLSAAHLEAKVVEAVAGVSEGAVARLYLANVDPQSYRLLDQAAIREAHAAALHVKLEPSFVDTATPVDLPELATIAASWRRFVEGQDLAGVDRERVETMGEQYISRALEQS
ncbi:MAG: metallophosphoesterase family protein [Acidimicrobiales bacterium]